MKHSFTVSPSAGRMEQVTLDANIVGAIILVANRNRAQDGEPHKVRAIKMLREICTTRNGDPLGLLEAKWIVDYILDNFLLAEPGEYKFEWVYHKPVTSRVVYTAA